MKEITIKCRINSRVFYELFKNQEEAFNLAGIPYSDDARKKVEKANLARKDKKNENTEKKPRRVIYVMHSRKYSDKYVKKSALMLDKLSISYMSYRRSNPHDFEVLINIYDSLESLIIEWYGFLEAKDPEYEIVKSLRNSLDHNKYNMISLGYDYSDLEASYYEICKNEFKEMVLRETRYLDTASLRYFYAMLNDIFGDPPDLITVT